VVKKYLRNESKVEMASDSLPRIQMVKKNSTRFSKYLNFDSKYKRTTRRKTIYVLHSSLKIFFFFYVKQNQFLSQGCILFKTNYPKF